MPPLQALVALHAFWVLLITPFAVWAIHALTPFNLVRLGTLLTLAGCAGVTILAGREALNWLPHVPEDVRRYFPQRVLFALAVLTDIPFLQITAVGLIFWWTGRHRFVRKAHGDLIPAHRQDPDPACPAPVDVSRAMEFDQEPRG